MQASNGSIDRNARDCMTPPSITVSTNAATSCGFAMPASRTHASTALRHAVKFRAMRSCAGAFSASSSSASRPIGQPVLAVRADEPPAVRVEQGKDALDGRLVLVEGRLDDVRVEQVLVRFEDGPQDGVLALEEVIEAAAVRARPLEQFREPGRRVAFFPEEFARRLHDPLPGVARLHT